jgi:hypothetical protein
MTEVSLEQIIFLLRFPGPNSCPGAGQCHLINKKPGENPRKNHKRKIYLPISAGNRPGNQEKDYIFRRRESRNYVEYLTM